VSHALLTIIAPVNPEHVEPARALIEALGNPATAEVAAAIEGLLADTRGLSIHFSSLNVFDASAGGGHLVFELSADGEAGALLSALAERLGGRLSPIFALARDRGDAPLDAYWKAHLVTVGQGFFDNPGVVFAGTPGQSVPRIRQECALAAHVATLLGDDAQQGSTALEQLNAVRRALRGDPQWHWALLPRETPALEPGRSIGHAAGPLARSALRTYLWPLFLPPIVAMLVILIQHGFTGPALVRSISTLFWAAILTALAAGVGVSLAYVSLRSREASDAPEDRPPDPRVVARIAARENFALQNHLAAVSVMKPGLLRRAVVRVVFWLIANLATHLYRPGFLGTLGTIHFARWVMVPGTGDLLFLSNYGGSWESYLEDFITKAHFGLTAVWSNTVGFPRTSNLVRGGASDGARFKRWARRQQVPTGFWYVAYPDVTTANIRTNAAIQQGLAAILTDEEASRWLSLFGSAARPASALEVNRIQSLVFGGLGFLPHGLCLGFRLSSDRASATRWLAAVKPAIAFGDGRKHPDGAVTLGLSPMALSKLGLPDESVDTFPPAFLDGICAPWRSRVLGDEEKDDPRDWWWGGPQSHVDGVLLVYAPTRLELRRLRKRMSAALSANGHEVVMFVPLRALPDRDATSDERRHAKREPFGFVDGVSQPIIRGTYKALRGADPIHIVEAGEFLLGYPDNRGFAPAGPTLPAIHDPDNVLPIAAGAQPGFANPIVNDPRDIGRNGTFLAIRQLEQYVDAFNDYCADTARQVQARFPHWDGVTPEFIGAKMIGRWRDGSSLVRFPYRSGTESHAEEHPMTRTAGGAAVMSLPLPAPAAAVKYVRSLQAAARRAAAAPDAPPAVNPIEPDNDFLFGAEDPQALRCPFGAHIRRSNPRESFEPGSQEQLAITNRHRILRVGRFYRPLKGQRPGLFFMCLNADIERQFEFVQQTWAQAPSFHGLCAERDPLLGSRSAADSFTIPSREGPIRLAGLPTFVRTRGGGYFFLPGRTLLDFLVTRGDAQA
jgi:deferrochelatase/peroxidase EfeB